MALESQDRASTGSSFGRSYWALAGIVGGLFVIVTLVLAVMIGTAEGPQAAPEPTLPTNGLDEITVIGTEFAFDPDTMVLNQGAIITFDNQGVVIHNIEIEGVPGFKLEAEAGMAASGTLDVAPGEYLTFCSIAGHREAGMEGTLTVAAG